MFVNIVSFIIFLLSPWVFAPGNLNEIKSDFLVRLHSISSPHIIVVSPIPHESSTPSLPPTTATSSITLSATSTLSIKTSQHSPKLPKLVSSSAHIKSVPIATSSTPSPFTPPPVFPPEPAPDFVTINTVSRPAVVNILCTTNGNELSPITGSGVIIDPRGIILTNAHVGQYWLLKDFYQKDFVKCVIRTGSPAYPRYHAELMYISPQWINNNLSLLKETDPKGTGEHDFAFLHITDSIDGSPLPSSFPFISPYVGNDTALDQPVILISYPAGFLGGLSILQDLDITSALTTVQKLYTFRDGTIDVISVGGTVVSQKGASGGAVINGKGQIIGLISTESEATQTADRDLRAITLFHIDQTISEETTGNLQDLLDEDPVQVTRDFQSTATTLSKLLITSLSK